MAKMTTITCKCGCGKTREVRQADINRGWGLYYNKSHKARHQEQMTGQYAEYKEREDDWRNLPKQLRILARNKKEQRYPKPTFDYWDRLAEIKSESDPTDWFHASH